MIELLVLTMITAAFRLQVGFPRRNDMCQGKKVNNEKCFVTFLACVSVLKCILMTYLSHFPPSLTFQTGQPVQPYEFWGFESCNGLKDPLEEFGIGIGLYFKSLKFLGCVIMLCALISLAAIYKNAKYAPTQSYVENFLESNPNATFEEPCLGAYCPAVYVSSANIFLAGSVYGAQRES